MQVIAVDHPLVAHKLTMLRRTNTDSATFRRLTEQLVTLLGYEATRDVRVHGGVEVQTPVAQASGGVHLDDPPPLVVPILRAGWGGCWKACCADADRRGRVRRDDPQRGDPGALHVRRAAAEGPVGSQCYVLDPMLATGGSLGGTINFLVNRGADHITCICLIAAPPEGIERVQELTEDLQVPCTLVVAGIDDHLDDHGYIVPGLGDAGGDRLYGLAE